MFPEIEDLEMWRKLVFLLLIFVSSYADSQTSVANLVQQIPKSDQRDLERFFQFLITRELIGYTLFGEKPISSVTYLSLKMAAGFNTTKSLILEKGWQAWLRNKKLFPENYFFLKRKNSDKTSTLYLINKKKALEIISKNLSEFSSFESPNPEEILTKICQDESNKNPFKSSSLLGVFYGYGENNSQNFERKTNLIQALINKMAPPFSFEKIAPKLLPATKALLLPLLKRRRFSAPGSSSMKDNIETLNQLVIHRKFFRLENEFFLKQIASPSFVFWDEEEERLLKDSYKKTRLRIKEIYQTGSFLEKTLQQWIMPE